VQDKGADSGLQEKAPINIGGAVVEWVESFKFLGVHITTELSWSKDGHEEGTTKPFLPQEKIWHGSPDPQSSTAAPSRAS
jgi:hypothetical protein